MDSPMPSVSLKISMRRGAGCLSRSNMGATDRHHPPSPLVSALSALSRVARPTGSVATLSGSVASDRHPATTATYGVCLGQRRQ